MDEIHKGDVGTILRVTVTDDGAAVDISAATTKQLWLRSPSGAVSTKTATFTGSGTDGKLQYTTIAGDLSSTGDWQIQAYCVFSSSSFLSQIGTFTVCENLK